MAEADKPQAEIVATAEPVTNFERLAKELSDDSLAAKLLHAWQSELDPDSRMKRMLEVAQPGLTQPREDADAPTD